VTVKKKPTKLSQSVKKCAKELTTGTVLAIDPSIGSQSSSMGYAVYKAGQLIDAGKLDIRSSLSKHKKLRMIRDCLMTEFENPDVLVIEWIPPMRINKGGPQAGSLTQGWVNLHQAAGAAMASVETNHVVEVAPVTWRKYINSEYEKGDVADAVLIGYAAIREATNQLDLPPPDLVFMIAAPKSEDTNE
jgi:hypothetical protein